VKDEILAKRHRALLIMGAGHFLRGHDQALEFELAAQQHCVVPIARAQLGPGKIERDLRAAGARSPVAGNELADKPVYVLTSGSTWSGAEQFSYDLKMLKRAILVGETTRGGTHAGVFHRIDDHFGIGIPEEKPINPFGKDDREAVGVQPDVKVKAADALETAVKLAETRVEKKQLRQ
jgi:C-terminal processing protease CtpA/Prc